ncbi:MAG: Lrp/AsnC family transcriptional regulator [Methanobacteriota archaeon]
MKGEKILKLLEDDGTLTPKEISTMLGMSEKEVKSAIIGLKEKGILKKSKAVVNWKKAGKRFANAFIQVKVVPQEKAGFARICNDIARDERVSDVFVGTGEYDLLLFLRCENLEDVSDFVTERLAPKKSVVGTNTHIILSEYKRDGVILADDKGERLAVSP